MCVMMCVRNELVWVKVCMQSLNRRFYLQIHRGIPKTDVGDRLVGEPLFFFIYLFKKYVRKEDIRLCR